VSCCRFTIVSLLAFCLFRPASSAPSDGRSLHLSVDTGLSNNSVYSVCQDAEGFLWIGTADGLNRYDGVEVVVFRHDPSDSASIADNAIRSLVADKAGNLYVATDKGIDLYNRTTGVFRHLTSRLRDKMFSLSGGRLLVAVGWQAGILKPEGGTTTDFCRDTLTGYPSVVIHAMVEDSRGMLWLGTTEGLFCHDPRAGTLRRCDALLGGAGREGRFRIRSLCLDRHQRLWIGVERGGLLCVDPAQPGVPARRFAGPGGRFDHDALTAVCADAGEMLWIGTALGHIVRFDPASGEFTDVGLRDRPPAARPVRTVNSIMRDRSGLIWISTDGDGVLMVNPHPPRFPIIAGLDGLFVRSILEDRRGDMWIGTFGRGLLRYHPATDRVSDIALSGIPAGSGMVAIYSLAEEGNGTIWAGSSVGLFACDPASGRTTRFDPVNEAGVRMQTHVYSLVVLSDGMIWAGTPGGICVFDPNTKRFVRWIRCASVPGGLGDDRITVLLQDGLRRIWVGTRGGGITVFAPGGQVLRRLDSGPEGSGGLSNNIVTGITQESDTSFWISTASGLNRYCSTTGSLERFSTRDGLPANYCYAPLRDGSGRFWLGTTRGLAAMVEGEGGRIRFRAYDVDDGLQSNEFNAQARWRARDGRLYFGGVRGVNAFYPDSVREHGIAPVVLLSGFKRAGSNAWKPVEQCWNADSAIVLPYDETGFSFQMSALEFTNSQKNRYAYKLEGLDEDWVQSGTQREIRFSRLEPGGYVLRVKASNGEGYWNNRGAAVRLMIVPPFWMRWEFRLGAVLVLMGGAAAGALGVERRKQARRLESLKRQHMLELERARISKDMHDEVGSSLTRIALLSEITRRQTDDGGEVSRNLDKITGLSREVIENVSQIVWAINPKHDSIDDLSAYVRSYVVDAFEQTNIRVTADFPELTERRMLTAQFRRNVFLAVKEAVHNILKHAAATEVRARLRVTDSRLEFSIEDNGAGFDPASARREGNGLQNMRQRVADLGGSWGVASEPGRGTRVWFEIGITTNG
jgi:signal transduction histidine kinase/ligand-binding sensor domain-containing protein